MDFPTLQDIIDSPLAALTCLWIASWFVRSRKHTGSDTQVPKGELELRIERDSDTWYAYVNNEFRGQNRDCEELLRLALRDGPAVEYRFFPRKQTLTADELDQVTRSIWAVAGKRTNVDK